MHELSHARNHTNGLRAADLAAPDGLDNRFNERAPNLEEFNAIRDENAYRSERGLRRKNSYWHTPGALSETEMERRAQYTGWDLDGFEEAGVPTPRITDLAAPPLG